MMSSFVYFCDLHANSSMNLLEKLVHLIKRAGVDEIDFKKKITAVKIHFGEPGNLSYIRPNFAASLVKYLKSLGAKPFLTDTNTLYHGRRSNAIDHIRSAFENGFNPLTVDCPVIIGDGLRGTDYTEITINQEYCRTAKIGKAFIDSDIIISMNHFKGHELTGFGGALKNLGMGCAAVGGKLELHSASAPEIAEENCTGCGLCEDYCAQGAIVVGTDNIARIDLNKCVGCGQCVAVCQYDAARVVWENASELVNRKIAEYTLAVLKDKPGFHVSFIMNVSPDCDCWNFNDYPLVPDIGMAASFDPVALDQACADMVREAPSLPSCRIHNNRTYSDHKGEDKFKLAHPEVFWEAALDHAEKIGIGTREYKLVPVN
ncbi:MAG: DUF362 domain-containing protein [Bacteroidales bacterium]|nr:DUF362 domain-containing protein [Bacteroidales bacterium]